MRDFYAGLHPDDLETTSAAFAAACDPQSRALYDVEYRTIGKEDGVLRWVAAKGRGLFADDNRCVRVIGTAIDITVRKSIEQALHDLNETLEQRVAQALAEKKVFADVVESSPAAVTALDLDYRILAINRANVDAFERAYGKRPQVGSHFLALFEGWPEHLEQQRAIWSRALAGETFEIVDQFGDAVHEQRCYEVRFSPLTNSRGERIGAASTCYDVTERVAAELKLAAAQEQLRQAQKMEAMGQLTGGVAHDFNNLLTPIIGSLDLLHRKGLGGEREQRLMTGAMQSAERARTLVQRLLAFARRQPLQPSAVDLASLVTGMAELIASTTGPQVRTTFDLAPGLPPAHADFNQLEMALLNLSVNARDAMPGGGQLTISARAESVHEGHHTALAPGHYVRLSVADVGCGMDEATRARAIEPFFSTKGVGKGTGLGLSMAHGLASQLGGALWLESEVGRGTEVQLWLPVSEDIIAVSPPRSGTPLEEGAGLVLVVDDEELVRISTADMLGELGYEVVEAQSAADALELIQGGLVPDLVVTDHLMPDMTGTELAEVLAGQGMTAPTLIVSGYAEGDGIPARFSRLAKPFRRDELGASIAALLG
jgi:PAS domain S-box-containing protein